MQLPPGKLEAPPRTLGVDTNYLVEVCGLQSQPPLEKEGEQERESADGAVAVLGCWSSVREEQEGGTGRPVAMDVAPGGQARPRQGTIIPLGGREVKNPVINYGKF